MSPVIKEHARARLVTDARDLPVVPVELRYGTSDTPDTILVAFPGGTEWAVDRDLLERGLRSPSRATASGSGRAAGPSWWSNAVRWAASRWCSSTARR